MREPVPAPTAASILCNVAQCLQGYLEQPPAGPVGTVTIPRAHLRRWLELVHSAVMLLEAGCGVVRWRLAVGGCALGGLVGWALS